MGKCICQINFNWIGIVLCVTFALNSSKIQSSVIAAPGDTTTPSSADHQDKNGRMKKYMSPVSDVILEHVDFVTLRLQHLMNQTSNNLTDLLKIQRDEFTTNSIYKDGWDRAKQIFNASTRYNLEHVYGNSSSILVDVPEEYHIALVAYTMQSPNVYSDFNEQTRQLCSHYDIVSFKYKSYFKLLELAVETLGKQLTPMGTGKTKQIRFLYRGIGKSFHLEEGQKVAFQHFISTSIKQTVAELFSSEKSVFEFDDDSKSSIGAYLGSHSVFANEEEVLLSPLQVFRVDSIHSGYHYTRYVLKAQAATSSDLDDRSYDWETKMDTSIVGKLVTAVTILASTLGVIGILGVIAGVIFCTLFIKKSRLNWNNSRSTESGLQLT